MKQIRPWLPYAGSLLILLALLWLIDLRDVLTLLRRTDLTWLAIGCGWYVLTNLLRAYRFRVLLDTDKIRNPFQILPEMFTLSLLNNVLPSRAGELSFPYFMQRRYAVSLGDGAATLLLARIFDLLAVILLYVVFAYAELQNLSETTVSIIERVAIAGGVISIGILFAPWFADFGVRLFETVLNKLGFRDKSIVKAILRLVNDAAAALQRMRRITIYGQTLAWSVAIWLATFAWFDAFLRAIDVPMRYALVVIGATFASVAKAIPLISIGGFGAHEAGWSLGFALVGMEQSLAISTGLAVNLLTLGVSIVFGGICLLYINK